MSLDTAPSELAQLPREAQASSRRIAYLPASTLGSVLGIAGLAQAWHLATPLWGLPSIVGQILLLIAVAVWAGLLLAYALQAFRLVDALRAEFSHPIAGATPALLGIATLVIAVALQPHAPVAGAWIGWAGLAWHLGFAVWHGAGVWRGGRDASHFAPPLYLPSVGGNLTSAAMLGAYGHADWGWLFLGAGVASWIAMESLMLQQIWRSATRPSVHPSIGIQFAPAVVTAVAWSLVDPSASPQLLLMLWGWALFQMLIGVRLLRWLTAEPWSSAYWAYTFGIASSAVIGCKLALLGVHAAQRLGLATFVFANITIGTLMLLSARDLFRRAIGR